MMMIIACSLSVWQCPIIAPGAQSSETDKTGGVTGRINRRGMLLREVQPLVTVGCAAPLLSHVGVRGCAKGATQ